MGSKRHEKDRKINLNKLKTYDSQDLQYRNQVLPDLGLSETVTGASLSDGVCEGLPAEHQTEATALV